MEKKCLYFFALILILAGCATSVTKDIIVGAEADPKIDYKDYSSYTWLGSASIIYDPDGKWEPPQFDADAQIKLLIDRELRARGMSEDSANPDMIVAFAAGVDMDSMGIDIPPESNLVALKGLPLATLVVILIDAKSKSAIWGGTASAEIQQNPSQETIKKRLDFAVTQMFKKLPK